LWVFFFLCGLGDVFVFFFFFFNDTATTEIYTLSLHDALPICSINIKEVRCCRFPLKARTDEGAWGSLSHVPGSWLGLLRRERSHSQLDSEMYANAAA